MLRMKSRQATKRIAILFALLSILSACSSSQATPTSTIVPATATSTFTPLPTFAPSTATPTSTPIACLAKPGRLENSILESSDPPQEFITYLPPCYDERADTRYPVLYLLHGQTYTADQWIRLGAAKTLDNLIMSGETMPFILVFPDDHYWYTPAGTTFGARLTDEIIPFIDETYRTIPDPRYRAIGGMSRGAGWALNLGLTHPELFSIIGLHSLAVFQHDASKVTGWIQSIPLGSRPVIFMDIGNNDQELASATQVEAVFTQLDIPHEWHIYTGEHTEEYWSAHVEEYIRWYAEQWTTR